MGFGPVRYRCVPSCYTTDILNTHFVRSFCKPYMWASLSASACHTGVAPQGSWAESKVFAKLKEDSKLVSMRQLPYVHFLFRQGKETVLLSNLFIS